MVLPTAPTAFIQFTNLTDSAQPSNFVSVPGSTQSITGRTGVITSPDVSMPNPFGSASSVNVSFVLGPNTVATPWPAAKTLTLEVGPLDPSQGVKTSYQTSTINCPALPSPGGNCTATINNVTLPLGFSSMTAFTVVNLTAGGLLARNFPATIEGEPIESVKIQTSGKNTEYILISKSGREFPYKPGTPR
jgi:hypothetical protein